MIRIEHVTKRFGRNAAVHDACLEVAPGESVALWGANGAGKTTLLRCVLGLVGFEGRITVCGHDVARAGKHARLAIGYVPQEIGFYDDLFVHEAVGFFARLKGLTSPDTDAVLGNVGLAGHESKRVRELSGGMKQRLALAIALLGDPPVLVLDEVTASLDAVGREEFVGLLERLSGAGRTMLFASHRTEEVATLARRVARMEKGAITQVQSSEEFVATFGHQSTLHIMLAAELREQAIAVLRQEGYAASRNGVGVLVPVSPANRVQPFRILADARIPLEDFEVLAGARAHHAAPARREENLS